MMIRALLLTALVLSASCAWTQAPFAPDEHTLLLAHFDEEAYAADYANGSETFAGTGASLADGYWGRALDTRGIQLVEDFMNTCSARVPRHVLWGFLPRGNVDFYQGTIEFWFRVSPPDTQQVHAGQNIFFTNWFQPIKGKMNSSLLNAEMLAWQWATLDSEHMSGTVNFDPPLSPDDWHHYAMCWSQGEFVIYIDGRAVDARDMTGRYGLSISAQMHSPVMMNGSLIDELRISSSVRYTDNFEPAWRGGARPAYAVEGPAEIERFDPRIEEPHVPAALPAPAAGEALQFEAQGRELSFDRASGGLLDTPTGRNGLLLWRGVEREALTDTTATGWEQAADGSLRFTQDFGGIVRAEQMLVEADAALAWEVTLTSTSADDLWLEALLSLPLTGERPDDYFDMAHLHDDPSQPMRRDEYAFSLPLAAVSEGGRAVGLGIDPHREVSALVSEYVPSGDDGHVLRQGTKLALAPGESFTIPFVIVEQPGEFGALDAIAAYHGIYPDLYQQLPEVPVYSYMPVCRYESFQLLPDLWRQTMMGNLWGHGPAFAKGAEWGTEELWVIPYDQTDRQDYNYVARLKGVWQSLERMRQQIVDRSQAMYNGTYTMRRSHYCPNWPNKFLPEMVWPEGMLGGDPLVAGQYYDPMYWHVNEFNTPMGEQYKWHTQQIMDAIAETTPGFINDMCMTSPWRFTDEIARSTNGRAWALDRGEYLVAAFGHADRYRLINDHRDARGFAQSIWSDGGTVSYTLSALSSANAIESGVPDVQLIQQELGWRSGRMLLGEKPFAMHYSKENEWIGRYISPDEFTPAELRDYYRYFTTQVQLMALKHGVHFPFDAVIGVQEAMETQPIVVQSITEGRKLVPGVRVGDRTDTFDHVFARRAGNGLDSFVVVANELPQAITEDVTCYPACFGGGPIFGVYDGGEIRHDCGTETVLREVTVEPRSMVGFRCIGLLTAGGGEITSNFSGDGVTASATITGGDAGSVLQVADLGPLYEIASVTRDGAAVELSEGALPLGGAVEITWRNRALDFSAEDWAQVELLRDGQPNFAVVADCSTPFRAGTAGMLNQFLEQYDTEDGVLGNMQQAPVADAAPEGFDGWQVVIDHAAQVDPARVRIEAAERRIIVEGATAGEARRAMVVLMRMVDRKYPHIGRLFPLKYYDGDEPWTKLKNEETVAFFAGFEDPKFLVKPVLRAEYEALYAGENVDFAGRYDLRQPVLIYEPTYADDYVYGREE
jgi:hypothetical protein